MHVQRVTWQAAWRAPRPPSSVTSVRARPVVGVLIVLAGAVERHLSTSSSRKLKDGMCCQLRAGRVRHHTSDWACVSRVCSVAPPRMACGQRVEERSMRIVTSYGRRGC